jgi:hypothetical protein
MSQTVWTATRTLAVMIVVAWATPAIGQAPLTKPATSSGSTAAAAEKWRLPRTPWGHPDLQGIWNNGTTTPLERPADLADREFLSETEWAARAKEVANRAQLRPADPEADLALAYNNEWWDRGKPLLRTSLIVDPPNGKLPALTAEGRKRVEARAAARKLRGPADSWEDRPLQERCIVYHGVPPFPTGYNNNYQIAQTPDTVAIRYEMMAETRIIPIDGRPHVPKNIRQWIGNPVGHWEGDTLVVETTNYSDKTTFRFPAANETLRVIERFTRTDENSIDYKFTVDDPTTYTRQWTAVLPLAKAEGPIYEYACHEGNHGMFGILSGHRADERKGTAEKR